MINIVQDIQSVTSFRRSSNKIIAQLKKSRRPIILTVEGKAEAVIQDAASYQDLLDLAAQASAEEGIRQGLDDVRHGRVRPAHDVFDEISAEYGIPG